MEHPMKGTETADRAVEATGEEEIGELRIALMNTDEEAMGPGIIQRTLQPFPLSGEEPAETTDHADPHR